MPRVNLGIITKVLFKPVKFSLFAGFYLYIA